MTLSQTWRNLLLSLHVAASVGVLGADLVLLTFGIAGVAGAEPLTIYPAARLVGASLVAPLALVALGTGVALALLTPWGLFKHWWVTIKLIIVVILSGVVVFVLVPSLGETAAMISGAAPRALSTSQRLPLLLASTGASILLASALLLAIFKPAWRLRAGQAALRPK
ncbi:putative integral membrane protein [Mesorhizobium metallidurans STM 2683]|uniref:Putative integral membrane protein n=1 Tax=Mesorhizobium metallidurans STM 2683 TaxID=1297569 RepID=M5EVF0_9HYPH|nr:hypothetical protein [Mesorhizobium metallidurans]CCV07888.1 putative integral membrane protein [Mesorhizobium metallidurans STM 2683]